MGAPEVKPLLSDEHFSVNATLLQAWEANALLVWIDREDDPPPPPSGPGEGFGVPNPGWKRAKVDSRAFILSYWPASPTSLQQRPAQGPCAIRQPPRLDCGLPRHPSSTGTGERDAAKAMAAAIPGAYKKTLWPDRNYVTKGLVAELGRIGLMPHVAQNTSLPCVSTIDGRSTLHYGYAQSINARRSIEKLFG
jgi:hypothetical protein